MKKVLASRLLRLAKRLDSSPPWPGEVLEISYTPGAQMRIEVKICSHEGVIMAGRVKPITAARSWR